MLENRGDIIIAEIIQVLKGEKPISEFVIYPYNSQWVHCVANIQSTAFDWAMASEIQI